MRPLTPPTKVVLLLALFAASWSAHVQADKRTVCTITVNSPDEKNIFRQRLPDDEFQFVELVEHGRPDWLASACRQGVRCDVLIVSGHFDSGTEFYSDRPGVREYLPVDEMERVSCSDSCPGLFSQLKEVYLFGCNTLNAETIPRASAEIGRSLVRAGYPPADADRVSRVLDERHSESSRDRMRRIFVNVPAIYGFSALAPLGPTAATILDRYFESAPAEEIGSGRVSPRLLSGFAANSMTVASGLTDSDPRSGFRRDVCQFVDDHGSADKVRFIHSVLRRDMAEVRLFFERIETVLASLSDEDRSNPALTAALDEIAKDGVARDRYLHFAEDADQPVIRVRMIGIAGSLGWLTPAQQRAEIVRLTRDLLARRSIGVPEVDLICSLNAGGDYDHERQGLAVPVAHTNQVAHAAALACLGSREARTRALSALTSRDGEELQIAQVYIAHRPITDVGEVRSLARGIAQMKASEAQVRALDTLARQRLSDRESLQVLARLFPRAHSIDLQRAIAAVFIRSDFQALADLDVARVMAQYRLKSPDGNDIIDILIRRLPPL
ncbi:MAG: hypothetical protein ABI831_27450 [Betaproteobacteria bacterium]